MKSCWAAKPNNRISPASTTRSRTFPSSNDRFIACRLKSFVLTLMLFTRGLLGRDNLSITRGRCHVSSYQTWHMWAAERRKQSSREQSEEKSITDVIDVTRRGRDRRIVAGPQQLLAVLLKLMVIFIKINLLWHQCAFKGSVKWKAENSKWSFECVQAIKPKNIMEIAKIK